MPKKRPCPICKSLNSKLMFSSTLKTFDGSQSPLNINISECLGCGFVYNDNFVDEETLNQFYTKENYYYTDDSFGTGGSDLSRYRDYVRFLRPFLHRTNTIIDVGCGKGQFVRYLLDEGFVNVHGIELDKRMVEIATNQGIPVKEGSAATLVSGAISVDMMIYTHVFEHLPDPDNVIRQARECLNDNGLLFIEVPDASRYSQARVFDFFWLATIEHVNHFSGRHLKLLLERHGFELTATSESIVPYNNPSFGYPALKMVFRKTGNRQSPRFQPGYDDRLRNVMQRHIAGEREFMSKHEQVINGLRDSKTKLYIWGIGKEFFILSSFTDLLDCNVQALLDKNRDKQGRTVGGIEIVSPDCLEQADADSTVLLTSVFNERSMREQADRISFAGPLISLPGRQTYG